MDVLWAPWRLDYILGPKPDECVFCILMIRQKTKNAAYLPVENIALSS